MSPTSTGESARLVMHSPEVARTVGLDPAECLTKSFAAVMSGNAQLPATQGRVLTLPFPCLPLCTPTT